MANINRVQYSTLQQEDIKDRFENLLTCSICSEDFDNTTRIPYTLSCHHTFCLECLKTLHKGNKKLTPCPNCWCQTRLKITQGNKLNVQKDFKIIQLIDIMSSLTELPGVFTASDITTPNCEGCDEVTSLASSICTTCNVKLCTECVKRHHLVDAFRIHDIKSIEELGFCIKHPHQILDWFCSSCFKITCCLCVLSDCEKHNVVAVDTAKTYLTEILLQKLDTVYEELQSSMSLIEEVDEGILQIINLQISIFEHFIIPESLVSKRNSPQRLDLLSEFTIIQGSLEVLGVLRRNTQLRNELVNKFSIYLKTSQNTKYLILETTDMKTTRFLAYLKLLQTVIAHEDKVNSSLLRTEHKINIEVLCFDEKANEKPLLKTVIKTFPLKAFPIAILVSEHEEVRDRIEKSLQNTPIQTECKSGNLEPITQSHSKTRQFKPITQSHLMIRNYKQPLWSKELLCIVIFIFILIIGLAIYVFLNPSENGETQRLHADTLENNNNLFQRCMDWSFKSFKRLEVFITSKTLELIYRFSK